jgi:hypothetical protein
MPNSEQKAALLGSRLKYSRSVCISGWLLPHSKTVYLYRRPSFLFKVSALNPV